jgi:hypothetical protein
MAGMAGLFDALITIIIRTAANPASSYWVIDYFFAINFNCVFNGPDWLAFYKGAVMHIGNGHGTATGDIVNQDGIFPGSCHAQLYYIKKFGIG